MQKALLLFISLVSLSFNTYAANVSGIISANTTWTKANSPYVVTGNLVVDTGATLIIEPGVKVLFDAGYFFQVRGVIMAEGNSTDSIVFTSNNTNPKREDWSGIEVLHKSLTDTMVFDYCKFEYADKAIYMRSNPAKITNCLFDDNGTAIQNLTFAESYIYVDKCRFEYCEYAIYAAGDVDATNSMFVSNGYGLFISGSGHHYFADNILAYNAYGINGFGTIHNNVIAYSNIAGIWGGGELTYNQLWYNKVGIVHRDWKGKVEHNGLKYNDIGIQGQYSSQPVDTGIRYNCIEYSVDKEYENTTPYHTNISDNYWGTTDSTTLDGKITDFYDNLTSGKTTFLPALQSADQGCKDSVNIPVLPPATVSKVNAITGVKIYPNPVSNTFTVEVQQPHTFKSIDVYNLTGQQVMSLQINATKTAIDAGALPQGLYLYKVLLDNNEVVIGKFLKE